MREISPVEIIIGVATHKHIHIAVAIGRLGARLGSITFQATSGCYLELEVWN
jgi:hypothetical protein